MSTINVPLSDQEYIDLKEYKNPSKWKDWKELNKKQRFILQRMIVGLPGGKIIVKEIAKEASHNLGHCKWCDHDAYVDIVKDVFK